MTEERIALTPCRLPRKALPLLMDKDPTARAGWSFSHADVEQILVDGRIPHDRRILYAILFLTGSRFGEAVALR